MLEPSARNRIAVLSVTFLLTWPAWGDTNLADQIRPVLDSLPPELGGLQVQLRQSPNPQISVRNPTGKTLTVLDDADNPFLRIGPDHVEGNYADPAFHQARFQADVPIPGNAKGPPRWHAIAHGAAYAWFDRRLQTANLNKPDLSYANGTVLVRRWRIPVKLGTETSAITGYFLYYLARDGYYRAQPVSQTPIAAHVAICRLAGLQPGLFVANHDNASFTVVGVNGEPFLRFLPGKVLVNRASPTWKAGAPRGTRVPYIKHPSGPAWAVISTTGAIGWRDPRLYPPRRTHGGPSHVVRQWRIPVQLAKGKTAIKGDTVWLPGDTGVP